MPAMAWVCALCLLALSPVSGDEGRAAEEELARDLQQLSAALEVKRDLSPVPLESRECAECGNVPVNPVPKRKHHTDNKKRKDKEDLRGTKPHLSENFIEDRKAPGSL